MKKKMKKIKKKIILILIVIYVIPEIAISVGRKYEPEEGTFDRRKRIVIQPICRLVKETNIPGDVVCEYQSQKRGEKTRKFILVLLEILVKKKLLVPKVMNKKKGPSIYRKRVWTLLEPANERTKHQK